MNEFYIQKFIMQRKSYLAPDSIRYYMENLTRFEKWLSISNLNIPELTSDNLRQYIIYLGLTGIKNVSLHTYYRAVRVFCLWLFQEGFINSDITQRIKLPKDDSEIVIPLTKDEVAVIDEYIIDSEMALRNFCIFHLFLDCGLRRQEVINLKTDCIGKNTLTIKNSKNNKSRIVLIPEFLRLSINNYLGKRSGIVFLNRYEQEPVTENTIKKLFANIKNLPGMERVHAHLLRHTFATSYLYYGGNMEMLRLLMGHSSYTILQNYVHLAAQEELIGSGLYELDEIFFKNRRKK